ncbi:hypothetical protein AB4Y90_16500 [Chryseobacterium sp. 2TAF14]|uniref:hypothetical protein n=1 Tax=Chryseobacterium sp. 2TAF14 TaxID=3233007 RepID=UPI003F9280EB
MKKILIMFLIVLSGFAFAQNDSSENPFIYEESNDFQEEDVLPGNPGDPNPAPIDDYIPALLIMTIVLTFVYAKKKKSLYTL